MDFQVFYEASSFIYGFWEDPCSISTSSAIMRGKRDELSVKYFGKNMRKTGPVLAVKGKQDISLR